MTKSLKMALLLLSWMVLLAPHSVVLAVEEPELTEVLPPKHNYSPLYGGIDFQYSPISYRSYDWLTTSQNGIVGSGVHIGLEWMPLARYYGKAAVGVNLGFNWINNAVIRNGENATLYTLPITPYIVYRADFIENQVLVPFAKIGPDVTLLQQNIRSSTGPRSTSRTYYGFDYSLGAELCLNFIDRRAATDLDSNIGINGTFITFEYVKSRNLKGGDANPDLTHEEYRLGMRFEM